MSGSLRDYPFRIAYGPRDDRVNEFYVPALSRSVRYDRAAGFFSSSALVAAAAGVARLIANRGRMRLLVGAELSEEDVLALQGGADLVRLVEDRMLASLEDIEDIEEIIVKERLAALAWMIHEGTLEVRVVLPRGPDGQPLPASVAREYYHAKFGVFTDAEGNQVAFSGSINESEQSWKLNYEQFMVFRSWEPAQQPYVRQLSQAFEELWNGTLGDWVALPLPEAVKRRLLRYRPNTPPKHDPCEKGRGEPSFDFDRGILQFLVDAPKMPNGHRIGRTVAVAKLWPHQERIVEKVVSTFPRSYLLCDEVGLGKTIEAGAILKELVLSGKVRRCLLLVPASVRRQWQEELYEKFLLNVPLYDGGVFTDYFGRKLPWEGDNPWNAFPWMIASSQLAKRRDRAGELLAADPWDLVIVDEAHHARRKDFLSGRYRRNRLLSLLLGSQDEPNLPGLVTKTRAVLLLTATPMQVDPREVWDLLTVLGLGGLWGASDDLFVRFFQELRNGPDATDWRFVLRMVRDHLENGGEIDPHFEKVAQDRLGPVVWRAIRELPFSERVGSELQTLNDQAKAYLVEFARRHTPLARFMFRNTRALLKEYAKRGLLGDNKVPERKPELVWIPMRPEERELYTRIEEYIAEFYQKHERERKGLGFIMTVYRRRLTSSFYALEKSLERRLRFLQGDLAAAELGGLTKEDVSDEDELGRDITEVLTGDLPRFHEEINYIENFLRDLRSMSTESKVERLFEDVAELLRRRETLLIFTLYTDTMDYLKEKLRAVYGAQVACYSGNGGEIWDGEKWVPTSKEYIKRAFRDEQVKILVGTDAMSEGLNLQTCGVMINFDMPWNPMRVEQRIGRIDRIGQRYPDVWIKNYFYEDTVEAKVYRALEGRINWFETVVGDLQPILAQIPRLIEQAAMMSGADRDAYLQRELAALRQQIDEQRLAALRLDEVLPAEPEVPAQETPPLTQADIERYFLQNTLFGSRFKPHPTQPGAYILEWKGEAIDVTFDPRLFDEYPQSLRLISYNEPLFSELLQYGLGSERPELPPWLIRFESHEPAVVAYYATTADGIEPVLSIKDFVQVLKESNRPSFDRTRKELAERTFLDYVEAIRAREAKIEEERRRAMDSALREQGRRLLLEATYIDLILSSRGETAPVSPNLETFCPEAVLALRRRGYPFAPLLRLLCVEGIEPSATDPLYTQLLVLPADQLRARLRTVDIQMRELLQKLVQTVQTESKASSL